MKEQIKLDGFGSFFNTLGYWMVYAICRLFVKPATIHEKVLGRISLRSDESVVFVRSLVSEGNSYQVTGPGLYCWFPGVAHIVEVQLIGKTIRTQRNEIRREFDCGVITAEDDDKGFATTAQVTAVLKFKPEQLINFEKLFGAEENAGEMLKNIVTEIAQQAIKPQPGTNNGRPVIPSYGSIITSLQTQIGNEVVVRNNSQTDRQAFINQLKTCVDLSITVTQPDWSNDSIARLSEYNVADAAENLNRKLQPTMPDQSIRGKVVGDYVIKGATILRGNMPGTQS